MLATTCRAEDLHPSLPLPLSRLTLEVLSTDHAGVHVVVAERHRAQLLEVKVENCAVDGVEKGAAAAQRVLWIGRHVGTVRII